MAAGAPSHSPLCHGDSEMKAARVTEQGAPPRALGKRRPPCLLLGEGAALGSIFRLHNHVQMSIPSLLLVGFSPSVSSVYPPPLPRSWLTFHVRATLIFEE